MHLQNVQYLDRQAGWRDTLSQTIVNDYRDYEDYEVLGEIGLREQKHDLQSLFKGA